MEKTNSSTTPGSEVPGEKTKTGTACIDTTASTIQSFTPINRIHQHLCAFHFYPFDMSRQLEAHHFCCHVNEDMHQCLVYDGPEENSRLIGLEYIITEKLFMTLPDEEKGYWHSHEFEVKSGILFMPGVPGAVQRKPLGTIAKTYGKVFHFWQVDLGHELPIGLPQVMMAVTRDGQLHPELAKRIEDNYGVSMEKEREARAYMTGLEHGIHPLANAGGKGLKTELRETEMKPINSVPRTSA